MATEVSVEIFYLDPKAGKVDAFRQDLSQWLKNGWKITSVVSSSENYIIYTFERQNQTSR